MFVVGEQVVHPTIPGIASVQGVDADYLTLKYGPKDVRRLSQKHPVTSLVRKATAAEIAMTQTFVVWTDPDTGADTRLDKRFLEVIRYIAVGRENAITTAELLELMGAPDTDSNRRQIRGAIDYYITEHSIAICSISSASGGYFVASHASEVEEAVNEKRRKASSLQRSAARLACFDVEASLMSRRNLLTAQ